jgi:hypothetical protein
MGTVRRTGDEPPSIQSSIGIQAARCRIAIAKGKNVVRPTVPRYDQARTRSKARAETDRRYPPTMLERRARCCLGRNREHHSRARR